MTTPSGEARSRRPSLVALVRSLPDLVRTLVEREIELLKTEVIGKLKALGIGAGLIAGAVGVLLAMFGVLLTAAILALSLVMPGWLAALLVAGILLLIALIIALVGYLILKRGIPPIPRESIDSLQKDLRVVRGLGKAEES